MLKYNYREVNIFISFSGKVVNPQTGDWVNNRLVLVFLKNMEMGRTVTALGEFPESGQGIIDGLFIISIPNAYNLTIYGLEQDGVPYHFEQTKRKGGWGFREGTFIYTWLGDLPEGSTTDLLIPSKNVKYVIKVLQGDINSLPPEMLQPGSTRLRDDGQIIVALPDSVSADGTQTNGIFVQDISYATKSEQIETNKLTVPINNCAGSVEVSQKYSQTQTFMHQYSGEVGFNVGVEIPLLLWTKWYSHNRWLVIETCSLEHVFV